MTKKANNNFYEIVMNSPYRTEDLRKFVSCDAKVYEIVKTFSDGSELRRYIFYDGSAHSVIFADGFIVEAVPIEKEDDLITWWEALIEDFKEANNG